MDWAAWTPYILAVASGVSTMAWVKFRSMDARITSNKEEIAANRLHVAENYVPRREFETLVEKLFDRVDKIYEIVGQKADRK